jgi:Tripartite tricarboxylate transporter TctB family
MKPLGFVVSFALLVFFIVAAVFRKGLATAGVTAVCAALAFWVVFPVVLDVPLPKGFLGF